MNSKEQIRKQMIKMRDSLDQRQVREKSRLIQEHLVNLDIYRAANKMMVYLDFRQEVYTGDLVREALKEGRAVMVPVARANDKSITPSRLLNPSEDLIPGLYGILEPRSGAFRPVKPEELDLVLVPGVAFDPAGNRLGYGGGYFDRFIPRLKKEAVTVALAYEFQMVPDLSSITGPHDQPVHYIITEDRVRQCFPRQNTLP
ncbi:5-formyltetrahydrofolate cyclo-ligase [Desulforamulus ruminis]|uniref:5-formyltetrahydrofolate cyclo-ligase n=1 Tax=Desulforamulus ruminis (strain ATCC 23193 / DSM 2154 / NCIMB 8452 / DL) TaxID=696281 RepID=F6DUG2_DESRL|nr:5-formyltetrahydrofolate cyclo-ligase [Desulforamulus ruminis]AEG59029.1 5-formyltetrahydrofolate cyclo-ligase [Desulforamulus ruminis DSM 2154]